MVLLVDMVVGRRRASKVDAEMQSIAANRRKRGEEKDQKKNQDNSIIPVVIRRSHRGYRDTLACIFSIFTLSHRIILCVLRTPQRIHEDDESREEPGN